MRQSRSDQWILSSPNRLNKATLRPKIHSQEKFCPSAEQLESQLNLLPKNYSLEEKSTA